MEQNQQDQYQLAPQSYRGETISNWCQAFGILIFIGGIIVSYLFINEAPRETKPLITLYGVIIIIVSIIGSLILGLLSAIVDNQIELRKEIETYFKKNS